MTSILVAEDNDGLRGLIRIHLSRAGYKVLEAADGVQALSVLEQEPVHLMIADIMMPHMDGYTLVRELRGAKYELPVLMMTARDTLEDKRAGFGAGADDYLTKPVDMEELLLHVEALLRRCRMTAAGSITVGSCTLHPETLTISGDGFEVQLRQKEFLLLEKLLSYPMRIFTRQELMDEIWGYDSESDPRTVDTHVKRLREKLTGVPGLELQSVRGLGYKAVIDR